MIMEFAKAQDKEKLLELYDLCFPGEHEYGEYYFDNFWRPDRMLVTWEGNEIAAMVNLMECQMVRDGKTVNAIYIFAAATHPRFRGRGIMGSMLERSFDLSVEWGADLSILITQNDSLFEYYKRFGYQPVFGVSKVLPSEELPSWMCKARMLNSDDAQRMQAVYAGSIAGRAAIGRTTERFAEILKEYRGHAFGLFDAVGNMVAYCLMDEKDVNALEIIGVGTGYLLYCCSTKPSECHGNGLPVGENDTPIGCAKSLTDEGKAFMDAASLPPYLNILFN